MSRIMDSSGTAISDHEQVILSRQSDGSSPELEAQERDFEELVEHEQKDLMDLSRTPRRSPEEDDGLASELETLKKSEDLLRLELEHLRSANFSFESEDGDTAGQTLAMSPSNLHIGSPDESCPSRASARTLRLGTQRETAEMLLEASTPPTSNRKRQSDPDIAAGPLTTSDAFGVPFNIAVPSLPVSSPVVDVLGEHDHDFVVTQLNSRSNRNVPRGTPTISPIIAQTTSPGDQGVVSSAIDMESTVFINFAGGTPLLPRMHSSSSEEDLFESPAEKRGQIHVRSPSPGVGASPPSNLRKSSSTEERDTTPIGRQLVSPPTIRSQMAQVTDIPWLKSHSGASPLRIDPLAVGIMNVRGEVESVGDGYVSSDYSVESSDHGGAATKWSDIVGVGQLDYTSSDGLDDMKDDDSSVSALSMQELSESGSPNRWPENVTINEDYYQLDFPHAMAEPSQVDESDTRDGSSADGRPTPISNIPIVASRSTDAGPLSSDSGPQAGIIVAIPLARTLLSTGGLNDKGKEAFCGARDKGERFYCIVFSILLLVVCAVVIPTFALVPNQAADEISPSTTQLPPSVSTSSSMNPSLAPAQAHPVPSINSTNNQQTAPPSIGVAPNISPHPSNSKLPASLPSSLPSTATSFMPSKRSVPMSSSMPSVHRSSQPSQISSRVPSPAPYLRSSSPTSFPTLLPSANRTLSISPISTPPLPPSSTPTLMPRSSVAPSGQPLLSFLEAISPDGGFALRINGTSQFQAYMWLNKSSMLATYSRERIIQRYALATLYFSAGGINWASSAQWLTDDDECTWFSRDRTSMCDSTGKVQKLELYYNNLQGSIPPELALLANLDTLDLSGGLGSALEGIIPTELGLLGKLADLGLRNNNLSGTLPSEIGSWTSMTSLDLSYNRLRGPLPTELGLLTQLEGISLASNKFSGTLPAELTAMLGLRSLYLQRNRFSGTLPSYLGNMSLLTQLNLASNHFTDFPSEIGRLAVLESLSLFSNNATGHLFTEIGNLVQLRQLLLGGNAFSSFLPTELGLLGMLNELDLSSNQFSGSIPSEIGQLGRLRILRLNGNLLQGTIPSEFVNLSRLNSLFLNDNKLTGTMPTNVCTAFNHTLPTVYIDCEQVACSCCAFCCGQELGCQCQYTATDYLWRCY